MTLNLEQRARELFFQLLPPHLARQNAIQLAREVAEEAAAWVEANAREAEKRGDKWASVGEYTLAERSRFVAEVLAKCARDLRARFAAPREEHRGIAQPEEQRPLESSVAGSSPAPSAIRRRTEGERRAYVQGHAAGLWRALREVACASAPEDHDKPEAHTKVDLDSYQSGGSNPHAPPALTNPEEQELERMNAPIGMTDADVLERAAGIIARELARGHDNSFDGNEMHVVKSIRATAAIIRERAQSAPDIFERFVAEYWPNDPPQRAKVVRVLRERFGPLVVALEQVAGSGCFSVGAAPNCPCISCRGKRALARLAGQPAHPPTPGEPTKET